MREHTAQIVQLVRAFEETDGEGLLLSMEARAAATRRSLRVTGLGDYGGDLLEAPHVLDGEVIVRRSRLLYGALDRKMPALRSLLNVGQLGVSTLPLVLAAALAAGLATNLLGSSRRVNLLSPVPLGVLAWNLLAYVGLVALPLLRRGTARLVRGERRARLPEALAALFMRGAIWRRLQGGFRLFDGRSASERRVTSRALLRFGALWNRCAAELLAARVRRMLHLGALALAAGAVGGMYVRGVALGYRVGWESAWLDAQSVQSILDVLLRPAAALLGVDVPAVPPAGAVAPAGPWIQLYVVTIALFVLAPRAALALFETARCAMHASNVEVDLTDPYFSRVLRDWRGATMRVNVVPYNHSPDPAALEALTRRLRDLFGGRADVRVHRPLAYGDESDMLIERVESKRPWRPPHRVEGGLSDGRFETCHALLFNLAQTPERAVHGRFLESLRERARARGRRLLVVVDPTDFARRVDSTERRTERVRAWEQLVAEAGLVLAVLDVAADDEEAVRWLEAALWPGDRHLLRESGTGCPAR